jgi:hypothetical protein
MCILIMISFILRIFKQTGLNFINFFKEKYVELLHNLQKAVDVLLDLMFS